MPKLLGAGRAFATLRMTKIGMPFDRCSSGICGGKSFLSDDDSLTREQYHDHF